MARPTGGYAPPMLDPDGWPGVDENAFYDRADEYMQVLHQVTEVLNACEHQHREVFASGVWSGGAASVASGELATNIGELVALQNNLDIVINWQRHVAGFIEQTKSTIRDNVEAAHKRITALERDSGLQPNQRSAAIINVLSATYTANVSEVESAADGIRDSEGWKAKYLVVKALLEKRASPAPEDSTAPDPKPQRDSGRDGPGRTLSKPSKTSAQPSVGAPLPGAVPPPPVTTPASVAPASTTAGPSSAAPPARTAPLGAAASAEALGTRGGDKGMTAASLGPSAAAPRSGGFAGGVAPAAATGMPAAPGAAGGSRGGTSGPGGAARSGGAPAGQDPTGAPGGMRAAAARSSARAEPPGRGKSAGQSSDAGAGPSIPVSEAGAEREAIAAADAAHRGATDPLMPARRIAAALNAPDSGGNRDLQFFWVTAVTLEGDIVVANSYGLAYIPDGVQLPEQVHMASADPAIPVAERARWATYPVVAVQGWAQHRNTKLRAVIATQEKLGDSDPGAAKVILTPADIPKSGAMIGRSRLEVIDPEAADRLTGTPDPRLATLVPGSPTAAGRPADRRTRLWLEAMRPMASRASGREVAHLRAFHAYTAHAREMALREAQIAVDPAVRRSAVADWMYWNRVTELLDAAHKAGPKR